MQQCLGMDKAFRDEEQNRRTRKDDKSDDGKGKEHPMDTQTTAQDANMIVATFSGGYVAFESKHQEKLTAR